MLSAFEPLLLTLWSVPVPNRGGNLTLLHFLLSLKTAAGDELVAALVVNILKVCPDLLTKYFKEVTFSFLPRVKSAWLNNVKLLNKVESMAELAGRAVSEQLGPVCVLACRGVQGGPVGDTLDCGVWWSCPLVALVFH